MGKRTTVVFDALLALHDLLLEQTWPAHPTTGEVPLVGFGDVREMLQEGIYLSGVLPEPAAQEWKTFGAPSKDETFVLRVAIVARVIGQERRQAVERIAEMHAVVESALRDQATGRPTGYFAETIDDVQYITPSVRTTAPIFGPLLDGGDGAGVDIDIAFTARI